ncbi:hypothetical protein [Sphingomonas sp.]|uniref:hypothetical protein n=1 Tax=Sphingomonas sp. TaxID=28214 RepID=UPI0025D30917|nr:hypothetical protein [Sphingomonas sp.]
MDRKSSIQMLSEMKLFASFTAAEQRFIRRSLDVGMNRGDANSWARGPEELQAIESQGRRYRSLDLIRDCIPDDIDPDGTECFIAPLINIAASDLAEGKLGDFEAFQFLYERLLGSGVRPWLISVFCAAAALPCVHPEQRKQLLQSIPVQSVVATGWSIRAPIFIPEWVEKVPEAVS